MSTVGRTSWACISWRLSRLGEYDREPCLFAGLTHSDQSTVSLYGTLDYGKAKSATARLSCDEGIEQSVTNLGRNPWPLVSDKYPVGTARELRMTVGQLVRLKLATLEKHVAIGR